VSVDQIPVSISPPRKQAHISQHIDPRKDPEDPWAGINGRIITKMEHVAAESGNLLKVKVWCPIMT